MNGIEKCGPDAAIGVDRQTAPVEADRHADSGWLGVASIAAGTFLLVTTEFLPIGLLSSLASGLGVSEGVAGLAVTAPGFIAAVAAPLLTVQVRKLDRRIVIIALTAAVVVSNLIGAFAPNFALFLVGRLVLGLAVGGLWTFAVAVGRRLVPASAGARVTSIISLGISAGTIFGVPVGSVADHWVGWRTVFAATAVLGLLVVLVQWRFLPRLAVATTIDLGRLLAFAKVPMARVGLVASGFVAAGHFIAYTFLEPYLRDTLRFGQIGVTSTLAGYAVAGIMGAFVGERLAVRNIRRAFIMVAALVGVSVAAASVVAGTPIHALVVVMVWGTAFGAVPVCVQLWMFASSPDLYEAGSALMVSAFQIALSAGAAVGGVLVDHAGIGPAFVVSGGVSLVGAFVALAFRVAPDSDRPSPVV